MRTEMLLVILGAGLITFCTRFPFMIISNKGKIPPGLARYMGFIAPAVMTALIIPAIFIRGGSLDISLNNNYIAASVITALSAYFTKNMLVSVFTGICAVGILMYIISLALH